MKRQIVTVAVVMVSVLIGMLIYQFVPLYGNDIPSIEKIIARHYDFVSIIDVQDIQNYRIVGFHSTGSKLGCAVFHKKVCRIINGNLRGLPMFRPAFVPFTSR